MPRRTMKRTSRARGSVYSGPFPTRPRFHDLPNELLYLIRGFLPKKNLRDHIAFQATCPQVRTLYENDNKFWKEACQAYGVSRPAPSETFPYTPSKVTWRQLAIAIVNHHECCDISTCKHWERADLPGETVVRDPEEVHTSGIKYSGFNTSINIVCGVFSGVAVPRNDEASRITSLGQESALILHSLGMCKFATNPPMREICINALGFRLLVKNRDGVTVWDVLDRFELFRWEHFSLTRFLLAYNSLYRTVPFLKAFKWIAKLTMRDVLPYIRDIVRSPGRLHGLENLYTVLQGYADALEHVNLSTSAARLAIANPELCDRCRLQQLLVYLGHRFPSFRSQTWYHTLLQYSSVESMLQQLIFLGLTAHPLVVEKFDGLEFDSVWKRID